MLSSLPESQGKVIGACVFVASCCYMGSRAAYGEELWCLCSESRWKRENTISLNSQLSRLIGILPDDSVSISELLQAPTHKHIHSAVTQSESGYLTQAVIKPEVLVKLLIEPCSRHQSPPIRCCLFYLFVRSHVLSKLDSIASIIPITTNKLLLHYVLKKNILNSLKKPFFPTVGLHKLFGLFGFIKSWKPTFCNTCKNSYSLWQI